MLLQELEKLEYFNTMQSKVSENINIFLFNAFIMQVPVDEYDTKELDIDTLNTLICDAYVTGYCDCLET